jgi:hypothetical protein
MSLKIGSNATKFGRNGVTGCHSRLFKWPLKLAHQHQSLYIKALAYCVDNQYPFQTVHGMLAKALTKFDDLVYYIGDEPSTNIFGQSSDASVWGKK